ncbi:MAG: glycosyltransferase family 39 protein [Bacteroidota bacterium]|nr:glycosyltransferase family 39 protein [Bacteroidota bacterium]MDP4236769.1 glycosyltransferase family 39 protein [Bacteroidota bacterium]
MYWNKIKDRIPEIVLLGAVAILQFYRLGIGEIQSWDESLYLIRAQACLKFSAWLDQTQYAIGGLYSSTHPPLVIWLMAYTRMIFGDGVFALRIVSAIAAVAAIFFFYKLALRLFSRWTALILATSLGTAQTFFWYGHHAQLDIPMLAFIMAAAYYAVRSFESDSSRSAIIAGLLYGCALSTKAVQGVYLLPFLLALPYIYRSANWKKNLILLLGSAFIVAAPWYIVMLLRHPDFYGDYAHLVGSMKAGTYAKEWTTEWWYYLNQIVINFPFLVLGVIAFPTILTKWKMRDTPHSRLSLFSILWFLGMLLFMSSFHTRMLHFLLFLFLPALMVAGVCIEELLNRKFEKGRAILFLSILLPAIAWSASELVRRSIRDRSMNLNLFQFEITPFLIAIALTAIVVILIYKRIPSSFQGVTMITAVAFLLCANFYRMAERREEAYVDGAGEVGAMLLRSPNIHSLTAYQDGFPHEVYLPQLNFYTEGWLLGWDSSRPGYTKTWDELDSLARIGSVPRTDASVMYVSWDVFYKPTPEEKSLLNRINQGLAARYNHVLHTKKYQLYWELK